MSRDKEKGRRDRKASMEEEEGEVMSRKEWRGGIWMKSGRRDLGRRKGE